MSSSLTLIFVTINFCAANISLYPVQCVLTPIETSVLCTLLILFYTYAYSTRIPKSYKGFLFKLYVYISYTLYTLIQTAKKKEENIRKRHFYITRKYTKSDILLFPFFLIFFTQRKAKS